MGIPKSNTTFSGKNKPEGTIRCIDIGMTDNTDEGNTIALQDFAITDITYDDSEIIETLYKNLDYRSTNKLEEPNVINNITSADPELSVKKASDLIKVFTQQMANISNADEEFIISALRDGANITNTASEDADLTIKDHSKAIAEAILMPEVA